MGYRSECYLRFPSEGEKQSRPALAESRLESESVLKSHSIRIAVLLLLGCAGLAQEQPSKQPQVRVNYLNVCTPSDAEREEIAAALARIPGKPRFAADFEVSRGRTSMDEASVIAGAGAQMSSETPSIARWVRIRREFPSQSPFLNAQYSFSVGDDRVTETLVFRWRDPKEVLQVSISDTVQSPTNPAQVAATNSPADRVRVERFGKGSVVLARCKDADQSPYEPLFQNANTLLTAYRTALGVQKTVASDLAKIPATEITGRIGKKR